jgi:hypothetical protein
MRGEMAQFVSAQAGKGVAHPFLSFHLPTYFTVDPSGSEPASSR